MSNVVKCMEAAQSPGRGAECYAFEHYRIRRGSIETTKEVAPRGRAYFCGPDIHTVSTRAHGLRARLTVSSCVKEAAVKCISGQQHPQQHS